MKQSTVGLKRIGSLISRVFGDAETTTKKNKYYKILRNPGT